MGAAAVEGFARLVTARRDIRRFRPDPVEPGTLRRILEAAHAAPSVGHSQPWRFVLVEDAVTRQRAAILADRQRLAQAAGMDERSGRHLLDLDLEGIREAPVGIVVCCDRRAAAGGVLGRATFADTDLWSCACAIENLWLAARAEGLGVGWVTLFRPDDLRNLVGAPDGVETLGWLCVGWPDERPPAPGLERRGWSARLPLDSVVLRERWPSSGAPAPPTSHLAPPTPPSPSGAPPTGPVLATEPSPSVAPPTSHLAPPSPSVAPPSRAAVVAARDEADRLLSTPRSLGVLDAAVDRLRVHGVDADGGTLVIAAADHPVARLGVSAYPVTVTREVVGAAVAGEALGAVAARGAGLEVLVVDAGVAGGPVPGAIDLRAPEGRGDLVGADAMEPAISNRLLEAGRTLGAEVGGRRIVALGEIGVGNTTVAAALSAALLASTPGDVVGLGSGADRSILDAKLAVVSGALSRLPPREHTARELLAALGGPEIAVLTGVVLGVAGAGGVVVLDGLATSVAALVALGEEPAVAAHLVAGQRSREPAHAAVLAALGLEPLLDLRIRAGEGAGAALAVGLLRHAGRVREGTARTSPPAPPGDADRSGRN